MWLINTHNGVKGRIPRTRIEDYPAVKAHLDRYWDKIKDRADQGDTPYNLRNCAYLEDFNRPKIVYREIGYEMDACMVPEDWYVNNKLYLIVGDFVDYLLAFLNSKVFNRIILPSANMTGGKGVDFLEKIRTPKDPHLITVIQRIVESKGKGWEDRVDIVFNKFFGLTEEESVFLSKDNSL